MTPDEMVREFHRACGVVDRVTPGIPDNEVEALRFELIREEYRELQDALAAGNVPAIAKEGADVVYVVLGTFLAYGIDFGPVFAAVHRSNMSKVGSGGQPVFREDGKVAKGDGYAEPDMASVLATQLDTTMARHSKDDAARCRICGTEWPCLIWVTAREEYDEHA